MQVFQDAEKRNWSLAVRVGSLDRIKTLLDIDFLNLSDIEQSLITKLLNDPLTIGQIAWAIILPQAEDKGVTRAQFLDSLTPSSVKWIQEALLKELPDFFIEMDQREGMQELLQKTKEIRNIAFKKLTNDLGTVSVKEVEEAMEKEREKASATSSTTAPESLE